MPVPGVPLTSSVAPTRVEPPARPATADDAAPAADSSANGTAGAGSGGAPTTTVTTPADQPLDSLDRHPVARGATVSRIEARAGELRHGSQQRDAASVASSARLAAMAAWRGVDLEIRRDLPHGSSRESAAVQAAIAIERARGVFGISTTNTDGTRAALDADITIDASGVKSGAKASGATIVDTPVGDVKLDGSGDVSVDANGAVRGSARGAASYDSGDGTKVRLDVDGSADANGIKGNAKLSGSTSGSVGDVKLDGSGDVTVDTTGVVRGSARGAASYDSGSGTKVRLDVNGSADATGIKGQAKLSGSTSASVGDVKLDGSGDVTVDVKGVVRGSARGAASYDSGDGTQVRLDVDGSAAASGITGNAKLSGNTSGRVGDVKLDGSGDVNVDAKGVVRGSARGAASYDSGDGTKVRLDVNGSADANGIKGNAKLSGSTSASVGDVTLDGSGEVTVDAVGSLSGAARVTAASTVAGARVDGGAGVRFGGAGVSGDVTARASFGQGKASTSVDSGLKVDSGGVRADANVRWERQVGSGSAGVQLTTERVGTTGSLKLGSGAQLDGSVGIERGSVDATARVRGEGSDFGGRVAFGRAKREAGGDATTMVSLGSFQGRALVRGRVGRASDAKDLGAIADAPGMRTVQLEKSTVVEAGGGLGVLLAGAVAGAGADGRRTTRTTWRTARADAEAQALLADPTQVEIPSLARPASIAIGDAVCVVTEGELSLYVEAGVLGATLAGRASVAGELSLAVERRSDDVVRITVAPTTIKRASLDGKAVVLTATLTSADLHGLSHTFDLDLSTRAGREAYAAAMCGRLPGPDELPSSAVALVDEMNASLPAGVRAVALAEERAKSWAVSGSLAYLLVGMTLEYDQTREETRTAEAGRVTVRRGSSQGTTRKSLLSGTAQARVSAEVITEEDASGTRVRGVSLVARFVDDAMRPAELERIVSELRDATGQKVPSFSGVTGEKREVELEVLVDTAALAALSADQARLELACGAASLSADAATALASALQASQDVGRRADALVDFVQAHGLRGVGAIARAWPSLPLSLRGRTDAYARVLADAQALMASTYMHPSSPQAWLFFERATLVAPVLAKLDEAIDALEVDPFTNDTDGALMDKLCEASVALAQCVDLRHLSRADVRELFHGLHTANLLHPAHAYGLVLAEMNARG